MRGHDDFDVLHEFNRCGLIRYEQVCTMPDSSVLEWQDQQGFDNMDVVLDADPAVSMTPKGAELASKLRGHRSTDGTYNDFEPLDIELSLDELERTFGEPHSDS